VSKFKKPWVYLLDRLKPNGEVDRTGLSVVTDVSERDDGIWFAEATSTPRRRLLPVVGELERLSDGTVITYDRDATRDAKVPMRARFRPLTREVFDELEDEVSEWEAMAEKYVTTGDVQAFYRYMMHAEIEDEDAA
jgi:hypothetical protein